MVRRVAERLNAMTVARLKKPGRYADGRGLYLQIKPDGGARSWIFRYERDGRERFMGLGPTHVVKLAEARELARAARTELLAGRDPIDARDASNEAMKRAASREITFQDAAAAYIAAHEAGWGNAKHRQQWENTLATYAAPVLGQLRARAIDTPDVLAVLKPIWNVKTETATRVRSVSVR